MPPFAESLAVEPPALDDEALSALLERYNAAYRRGEPEITDAEYDRLFAELNSRQPDHPAVTTVEPEPDDVFNGERVKLPVSMLSTDKAYTQADVDGFVRRVSDAAAKLGMDPADVLLRVTPKLDGMAGLDLDGRLMSRGNGHFGSDITHAFARGVHPVGGRGRGAGEIVIVQRFFDEELAPRFDLNHPRNTVVGLVGAETLEDYHHVVLDAGACHFVPYSTLEGLTVRLEALAHEWEALMTQAQDVPYLCDGAVVEVIDPALKAAMGATSHHHRWQIALKHNDVEAEAKVIGVRLTTGRTGRVTPTIEIEPTLLYGVVIRRVTAHHAAHLLDSKLGPGAVVRITRAGGVIPYITGIVSEGTDQADLSHCPVCGGPTEWEGDKYLVCASPATCHAQAARTIQHFFQTIGTCNGFGPVICEALARAGITDIPAIYRMSIEDFVAVGISQGNARNLVLELGRSVREPLSDYLLLGALGLRHLGRGDSRKLLAVVPIDQLDTLTVEKLQAIPGFGEVTSEPVVEGIRRSLPVLNALLTRGFNLERTPLASEATDQSGKDEGLPLSGQTVVFTGTMNSGTRQDAERHARALGAETASSVTGRVTLLVCGANVGATKMNKARSLGIQMLSEAEYIERFGR